MIPQQRVFNQEFYGINMHHHRSLLIWDVIRIQILLQEATENTQDRQMEQKKTER
jgi:hypothetical protein